MQDVAEQFTHIHSVRLMWLKAAAPEFMEDLNKIEKPVAITKDLLVTSLSNSSAAIENLLEKDFKEGKIKNFKPHPSAFLDYLLAHEAHHRGKLFYL